MTDKAGSALPEDPADPQTPPRFRGAHLALIALFAILHSLFVIPQWGEAYLDFGDGNYIYIASRIADGIVPYRDVLAPQPPCHLFAGAGLVTLSRLAGMETPILLIRAYSLLLHLCTAFLCASIALIAWRSAAAGVAGGAVYLLLPINLWWGMGFQSEPLEILFLALMVRLALADRPATDCAASLCGGLAALTNATAAPFLLVLLLAMLSVDVRRAMRLALPAAILGACVTLGLEAWTGGYFLDNTVLNQTGTYPKDAFLQYALYKIRREGVDIVWLEGGFIALALAGWLRFASTSRSFPGRTSSRALTAFFLTTLFSFLYVTKGGTVDYIFCLAGPALAIMAPGGVFAATSRLRAVFRTGGRIGPASALLFASFFVLGPLAALCGDLWSQRSFELPSLPPDRMTAPDGQPRPCVEIVKNWIDRYSKPGDAILAPPFYAVVTNRRLWGEYCEIFIWTMKYGNDVNANNREGDGYRKVKAMEAALDAKEIPLVIIELDQTGRIREIKEALERNYVAITETPLQTLNTRLAAYAPKR